MLSCQRVGLSAICAWGTRALLHPFTPLKEIVYDSDTSRQLYMLERIVVV